MGSEMCIRDSDDLIDDLSALDLNELSPIEAWQFLDRVIKAVKK